MNDFYFDCFRSPVGIIKIAASDKGIVYLTFLDSLPDDQADPNQFTQNAVSQLKKYFEGKLKKFDLPLELQGTDFQVNVWTELLEIPFGVTRSYLEIADAVGDRNSIRAVGKANGENKIAIVVPCHRVIGSDGKLTGYAGGLWRKKWLLDHEKKYSGSEMQLELGL